MDTQILPASEAEGLPRGPLHGPKGHRPPVHPEGRRVTSLPRGPSRGLEAHESPVTPCKPFSFTLLSKNALANHLESHSCKNKGLKVPCFHTLTKKGVGEGVAHSNIQHLPSNFRSSILAVAELPPIEQTINPPTAQRQPCNAG